MRSICVPLVFLAITSTAAIGQRSTDDSTSDAIARALRAGRYAEATRLIEKVLGSEPNSGLRNIHEMLQGRPDMEVKNGVATFACDVSSAGLRLNGSANGQSVSWLLDTGANFSVISDAEAVRLGMRINETSGRAGDLAGGSVAARTATAERLTIGSTEMRGVTFLVTPASEMPWKELPAGNARRPSATSRPGSGAASFRRGLAGCRCEESRRSCGSDSCGSRPVRFARS